MNNEFNFEAPKTDEEQFAEIKELIEEGWKFKGNVFGKDQVYRLELSKEGEEDKIFHTARPYPDMVDSAGETRASS